MHQHRLIQNCHTNLKNPNGKQTQTKPAYI